MLSFIPDGVKIVVLLFFINVPLSQSSGTSEFLNRLINRNKDGPVVVFLEPSDSGTKLTAVDINREGKPQEVEIQIFDKNNNEENAEETLRDKDNKYENADETESNYVATPGENDAYVLYNILRSTQQEEDLDEDANNIFEKTKDILREAFILRCAARKQCEKKCPPKKVECTTTCQEPTTTTPKPCSKRTCKTTTTTTTETDQETTTKKQCVEECVPKPSTCEKKCETKIDSLDACEAPPKQSCGGGCRGRTMPPKWLRRGLHPKSI